MLKITLYSLLHPPGKLNEVVLQVE